MQIPKLIRFSSTITLSGKAMLHMLRSRLAPSKLQGNRNLQASQQTQSMQDQIPEDAGKSGALSKVFALWNKKGDSTTLSKTKKKLATV